MLNPDIFNRFIDKANHAYQQFCVWVGVNNKCFKHQNRWNKLESGISGHITSKFTKRHGPRYKNFWGVVVPTLQQSFILGTARLFDPPYHPRDAKHEKPRLSLDYILVELGNEKFARLIKNQQILHQTLINSIKSHRDNFYAHNSIYFDSPKIVGGIENLFEWLENVVLEIKNIDPLLKNCKIINLEYTEKLSRAGVNEIFEDLLLGEKTNSEQ